MSAIGSAAKTFRRKAAGTPAGGQFDNRYHREVSLELTLDEMEANREGSFESPPYARSAAQVIDFWLNCEIPNAIINQCLDQSDGYAEPEIGRQLVRCEMMNRDARVILNESSEEYNKIMEFGVPFPDGRRFRPLDALTWYGTGWRAVPWAEGDPIPEEWS